MAHITFTGSITDLYEQRHKLAVLLKKAGVNVRNHIDLFIQPGKEYRVIIEEVAPAVLPEEMRVFKDGNAWCAVLPDFENLHESPAGFGDTPAEAIANLERTVRESVSPPPA